MDPIQQRIASLTPERRALLEQRLMTAAAGTAQERIPRRAGHTPRPLSFAQERLWFLDQLLPGGVAYNTSHAVRIRGALDVEVCGGPSMRPSRATRRSAPSSSRRTASPFKPSWTTSRRPCPCSTSASSPTASERR